MIASGDLNQTQTHTQTHRGIYTKGIYTNRGACFRRMMPKVKATQIHLVEFCSGQLHCHLKIKHKWRHEVGDGGKVWIEKKCVW